jgi:hypothetical protein
MTLTTLTAEQETEAQQLAQRIEQASRSDILELARLLVSKREAEIFGETEFQVRDLVHRIGATAYQEHLAQKKTATGAAASAVLTAAKPPSFKITGRKRP